MLNRKVFAEEIGMVALPLPANRIRFHILRIAIELVARKGNEVVEIFLEETKRSVACKIAHSRRRPRLETPDMSPKRVLATTAKDNNGMGRICTIHRTPFLFKIETPTVVKGAPLPLRLCFALWNRLPIGRRYLGLRLRRGAVLIVTK